MSEDNPTTPKADENDATSFYAIRLVGVNGRTSYNGPIWVQSHELS